MPLYSGLGILIAGIRWSIFCIKRFSLKRYGKTHIPLCNLILLERLAIVVIFKRRVNSDCYLKSGLAENIDAAVSQLPQIV
jgi:hypothetical protein